MLSKLLIASGILSVCIIVASCGGEEDRCPKACVNLMECVEEGVFPVYCHCPGKVTPECQMTIYLSPEDADCILTASDCATILDCAPTGIFSPPCR